MVKDFNIHDLTDQLAQNPLNLSYDQTVAKYQIPPRTTTRPHTYDPVPNPNGIEYLFKLGHRNSDSIRFIRDVTREFGKQITNISVFIIAHTDNPENYFTDELSEAYNKILNNLNLQELQIANQANQENKKILVGLWRNKHGVDFLDVGALYTKIQRHTAKEISDLYDQKASVEINQNGKVRLI
jgi:hypothetical protein